MARRASLVVLSICLLMPACRSSRRPIIIGSKNFTEQVVLGELLAQHIASRTKLPVERRFNLGGTYICQDAVRTGQIDLYVEYTGTALTAILGEKPSSDPAEVYARVKAAYQKRFKLAVTAPLGFNNSFAMVIRGEDARRLKLKTISDLVPYAPKWQAAFGYEFMERPDGYHGLVKTYHLHFGRDPRIMELGLLYRALLEKQADIVAGSATDGAISAHDFVVLEDDKHYFPPYDAVPIVREQTLRRHAALAGALADLAGKISEDEMRRMNYAVDGEHRDVKQEVAEFLRRKHL